MLIELARIFFVSDRSVEATRLCCNFLFKMRTADYVERSGEIQRLCGGSARLFRNFFLNSDGICGFV